MIEWAVRWIVWAVIRAVITIACILSLQFLIHTQGYFVPFKVLLVSAVMVIVGVKVWLGAGPKKTVETKEVYWSGEE